MASWYKLGFRFHPTDAELMNHLKRFMLRGISPSADLIKIKEVFGDSEPWEIIDGEKTCYFLSRLTFRQNSTTRFSRTVGTGTWKGQTRGIPINVGSKKNVTIGCKRSLRYQSEIRKDQSEKWLLKEYSLPHEYIKKSGIKDIYVICKIREKKNKEEENNNNCEEVMEEDVDELFDHLLGRNNDQLQANYGLMPNYEQNNVQHEYYGEANNYYLEGGDHQVEQFTDQVITKDDDNQLKVNYEASTSTLNNNNVQHEDQINGEANNNNDLEGGNTYEEYSTEDWLNILDLS